MIVTQGLSQAVIKVSSGLQSFQDSNGGYFTSKLIHMELPHAITFGFPQVK